MEKTTNFISSDHYSCNEVKISKKETLEDRMRKSANLMLSDYLNDKELTQLINLDSEDFLHV
jgi:hypothetical protein